MRRDFVDTVSQMFQIRRRDLIEKDLILHQLLLDLSQDRYLSSNFLFKGGTCLIKHYLGYFRFSEDIDFTWRVQEIFMSMTQKEIRRQLSWVIDETGAVFEDIAKKRQLNFRCDKGDRDYVELGGGNKTCTFKLWYDSEILGRRSFVKVQINFVEKLCFPADEAELRSLISDGSREIELLFPEYREYLKPIPFRIYDVREILCEKVRAILTRVGVKARDFVDIYLIKEKFGIDPEKYTDCIKEKTAFALKLYQKYRQNLRAKKHLIESKRLFKWGDEKDLLLRPINEKQFNQFNTTFLEHLKNIAETLNT
ncbi:MAG: hypothetical protein DRI26_03610 [Chloroflexi bacterium]|nr:MAG: hypothetical protein DRI26_03610 [Chloroflexota bacterium]